MSENAATAGDGRFGSTRERGNGGRRTANSDGDTVTATKWAGFPPEFFPSSNRLFRFPSDLQMGWLSSFFFPSSNSFLRFGSDLEIVSICLLFIEFFVSILGSSKMVQGWSFFVKGISVFFMLEYLDLVQNLLVHGCDFRLPTAIILRVEWVFAVFC